MKETINLFKESIMRFQRTNKRMKIEHAGKIIKENEK